MKKIQFTLIELVWVVMITVVVIICLMLVARVSREKTRRANCGGNLKCIGLAMLGYSGDYGGTFLPIPEGNSFELLNEEHSNDLPNSKVYGCPSSPRLATLASQSNYWYVGSGIRDDVKNAKTVVLSYDMFGNHPTNNAWMNVLFVDGHVEGAKPDGKLGWNDNCHAVWPKR